MKRQRVKVTIDSWLKGGGMKRESGRPGTSVERPKDDQEGPSVEAKFQKGHIVLVGADIEALYPNLDSHKTGEAIREETKISDVKWEGTTPCQAASPMRTSGSTRRKDRTSRTRRRSW